MRTIKMFFLFQFIVFSGCLEIIKPRVYYHIELKEFDPICYSHFPDSMILNIDDGIEAELPASLKYTGTCGVSLFDHTVDSVFLSVLLSSNYIQVDENVLVRKDLDLTDHSNAIHRLPKLRLTRFEEAKKFDPILFDKMKFLIIEERFGLFIDESYYKNDSTEDINPEKHGMYKGFGYNNESQLFLYWFSIW